MEFYKEKLRGKLVSLINKFKKSLTYSSDKTVILTTHQYLDNDKYSRFKSSLEKWMQTGNVFTM